MTTHIFYGAKRDGKLHPATICDNPKHAMDLARIYCHNSIADRPDQNSNYGQSAWDHLIETGRIQVVELYCRETTTGRECK